MVRQVRPGAIAKGDGLVEVRHGTIRLHGGWKGGKREEDGVGACMGSGRMACQHAHLGGGVLVDSSEHLLEVNVVLVRPERHLHLRGHLWRASGDLR